MADKSLNITIVCHKHMQICEGGIRIAVMNLSTLLAENVIRLLVMTDLHIILSAQLR